MAEQREYKSLPFSSVSSEHASLADVERKEMLLLRSIHRFERALPFGHHASTAEPTTSAISELDLSAKEWPSLVSELSACGAHDADAAHAVLKVVQNKTFADTDFASALPDLLIEIRNLMEAHRAHSGVQTLGCSALANICATDACAQAAVEARVVTAVLGAMDALPLDVHVQEQACLALSNMSLWEGEPGRELKRVAAATGALPALVRAAGLQGDHAGVVTWASWAIAGLCLGSSKLVEAARHAGVAAVLTSAKHTHASNASVMASLDVLTSVVGKGGELLRVAGPMDALLHKMVRADFLREKRLSSAASAVQE